MKKEKRKILLMRIMCSLSCVISFSTCSIGNVYGAERQKTGKVDIELAEYELDAEGKEIPYNNNKLVLPGDVISKIPRIKNLEDPCYIRVKWEYADDSEEDGLTDENIGGISEDWVKKDGYYYYKKILENKEFVDVFTSVSFPAEWTEAHSLQNLEIPIVVEAIGMEETIPDYEKGDPWNGAAPQKAATVKTGDHAAWMLWAGVLLCSFGIVVVLIKKKGART